MWGVERGGAGCRTASAPSPHGEGKRFLRNGKRLPRSRQQTLGVFVRAGRGRPETATGPFPGEDDRGGRTREPPDEGVLTGWHGQTPDYARHGIGDTGFEAPRGGQDRPERGDGQAGDRRDGPQPGRTRGAGRRCVLVSPGVHRHPGAPPYPGSGGRSEGRPPMRPSSPGDGGGRTGGGEGPGRGQGGDGQRPGGVLHGTPITFGVRSRLRVAYSPAAATPPGRPARPRSGRAARRRGGPGRPRRLGGWCRTC